MLDAHLILFLSLVPLAAWASQTCKCFPGDPCYPTQFKWDAFSASLSRPLLAQRPAAAPCYQSSPAFDAAACALANSDATNVTALSGLSNTLQWKNFEFLINDTTVQDCPFNPTPNATCFQGRVPVYSVQVGTVEDIQATMRFASEYNLRLVVKNTGHEQLGRPFGVGALELYMHDMDALKFSETFVPQGAPPGTAAQPAFTIGPGVGWKDVYAQANLQNYTVVGGFSVNGTVGAGGGWALGGGHSVLGSSYGMGVDNILQFTVVLPNASHVTANEFVNTQLFWALRGGGGPSFGVITSLTYRTHPNPAYTGGFFTATANSTSAYQSLIQLWLENHNAVADGGWGGPWPLVGSELAITLITPGSPPSNPTALLSLQKFFNASRTLAGVNVTEADVFPYASFEEFAHDNLGIETLHHGIDFASDAFNFAGSHTFTTSWLLPRDLTTPSNASMLAEIFSKLPGATPFLVAGGAVSKVASDATAITPAWRTALTDFTINTIWEPTQEPAEIQRVAQTLHDSITPLRQLAPIPAGGQYLNEADWLQDDWQAAQWGSNYARLLEIKREIDPHDLLIVRHGVNSEGWDDEIICKTL